VARTPLHATESDIVEEDYHAVWTALVWTGPGEGRCSNEIRGERERRRRRSERGEAEIA